MKRPIAIISRLKGSATKQIQPIGAFACLMIAWLSITCILFFAEPTQPWRMIALGSSYLLTALVGYLALSGDIKEWKTVACLAGLLVLGQAVLKITYRVFIPGFLDRAGDEPFWVAAMRDFQNSGRIPEFWRGPPTLPQGPGIYYFVQLLSPFFSGNYNEALTGMTILLGSIYVIPVIATQYAMTDSKRLALFAATISVGFDVIAYSTMIARPTIIAITLMPILVYLFAECRKRNRIRTWVAFFLLSMILMFSHPIGWVAFLVVVSAFWLVSGFKTRTEKASAVLLFEIYAFVLMFVLRGTSGVLTTEVMGKTPLAALSEVARYELLPIWLLIPPLCLLIFDSLRKRHLSRLVLVSHRPLPPRRWLYIVSLSLLGLTAIFAYVVWAKYEEYILVTYGSFSQFLVLHGWKIPIVALALYGLILTVSAKRRGDGSNIALTWLFSIMGLVLFLALFLPYQGSPGLRNLDERFYEFGIFPATTFIAYGLDGLGKRVHNPIARMLLMLLFSAFVILSLMVGLRDPILFH